MSFALLNRPLERVLKIFDSVLIMHITRKEALDNVSIFIYSSSKYEDVVLSTFLLLAPSSFSRAKLIMTLYRGGTDLGTPKMPSLPRDN